VGIGLNGFKAGIVAIGSRHLEQLGVVGQLAGQAVEHQHHVFERAFFFAQLLGALGVVPHRGVFERRMDFAQFEGFGIVVKDTSVTQRHARSGR